MKNLNHHHILMGSFFILIGWCALGFTASSVGVGTAKEIPSHIEQYISVQQFIFWLCGGLVFLSSAIFAYWFSVIKSLQKTNGEQWESQNKFNRRLGVIEGRCAAFHKIPISEGNHD
jgi:hypothetical protein